MNYVGNPQAGRPFNYNRLVGQGKESGQGCGSSSMSLEDIMKRLAYTTLQLKQNQDTTYAELGHPGG